MMMQEMFLHMPESILCVGIVKLVFKFFIGNRGRTDVLENRNIVKELQVGMNIAFNNETDGTLKIAEVKCISPNPNINSFIECCLMKQERAPHKPKWIRTFSKTEKMHTVKYIDILLYDFQLTRNGALKKKTREYLTLNNNTIKTT